MCLAVLVAYYSLENQEARKSIITFDIFQSSLYDEQSKTSSSLKWSPVELYTQGRGYTKKNWVRVCSPLSETLTLFHAQIYDFPCPIWDLPIKIISLFQTCLIISFQFQRVFKGLKNTLSDKWYLIQIEPKLIGIVKNIPHRHAYQSKAIMAKRVPRTHTRSCVGLSIQFYTIQLLECTNHTLFQTKTAKSHNTAHNYEAHIRE